MISIIVLAILVIFVIFSWISLLTDAKKSKFRGPTPLPIVGNGHLFFGDSTDCLKTLGDLVKKYDGKAQFYLLSNRLLLWTDLKYIEALTTSTEFITKGKSYDFLFPWLGQGLLTSTGDKWKLHRKLLTPAFHFNILQTFLPIFLKNGKILVNKLRSRADHSEIDLFPVMALTALDNVIESIMGVSVNAQTETESEYVQAIADISDILAYRMRNAFASIDALFNMMPKKKVQDRALEVLHRYSRSVIETRQKELEKSNISNLGNESELGIKNRHDFLDMLLLADIDGKKIDPEHIREEVDTFMFEGHDTTTAGTAYSLYCISKNQEVQEKILKEQKLILGDNFIRDPSFTDLQQMKYLEMVIKESMRLYPPVPLFERVINQDTVIAGAEISKGTSIIVDIYHMQRDPENFENPLDFRPERFEKPLKNAFSYLAFSAGPRNCIGQKFAMLQMKTILSTLVKHYKVLPSLKEPVPGADLVLKSKTGVNVQLEPR